ncbi:hypothetical protein ALC57_10158 [Trachymyrmex cornetzi]|uniref:Uncharacterized protein n=1 Tax=Trachymyrmex cornetzi TaxID=471704 RepID=A0A151J4J4_9HYME|nr:hypothetical protein ALC57_10158 [Trachymyrmex cornetzi]
MPTSLVTTMTTLTSPIFYLQKIKQEVHRAIQKQKQRENRYKFGRTARPTPSALPAALKEHASPALAVSTVPTTLPSSTVLFANAITPAGYISPATAGYLPIPSAPVGYAPISSASAQQAPAGYAPVSSAPAGYVPIPFGPAGYVPASSGPAGYMPVYK